MPNTWYADPTNGNANYAGSSFALKTSATDGVANGTTTFTSATAVFTVAMVGQRINILTKGYRTIVGWTNATTVVLNSTVTAGTGLTFYVGGALQHPGQGTSTVGVAAGDTGHMAGTGAVVRVLSTAGANVNATFTDGSPTLTLSAAATLNIHDCGSAWTADNGSTVGTSSTRKEGTLAATITTTTTPQIRAHVASQTVDNSSCSKICFDIRSSVAQVASCIRVDFCTDTAGLVPAHSVTVNFAMAANTWNIMEFNNGGALSNNINSVSITTLAGIAAGTLIIDNILACNLLTLGTVISKDSAHATDNTTDGWWSIRSINGTTVTLGCGINQGINDNTPLGYSGTTATVALYAAPVVYIDSITQGFTLPVAATAASPVTWRGGYDTASDTLTGVTWLGRNGSNSNANLITWAAGNVIERINSRGGAMNAASNDAIFRGCVTDVSGAPISTSGTIGTVNGYSVSNSTSGSSFGATITIIEGGLFVSCQSQNITMGGTASATLIRGNTTAGNAPLQNINISGANNTLEIDAGVTLSIRCTGNAIGLRGDSSPRIHCRGTISCSGATIVTSTIAGAFSGYINRFVSTNTGTAAIAMGGASGGWLGGQLKINSCLLSETNVVTFSPSADTYLDSFVAIGTFNDTAGNYRVYTPLGTMFSDAVNTHGGATRGWTLTPNSSASSTLPLRIPVQALAVDNTSTNVTLYVKRTNAAHVAGIMYAGDLFGQSAVVLAPDTGTFNNWNAVTITVGAGSSATGAFQLYLYAYGNTGAVYFSKL